MSKEYDNIDELFKAELGGSAPKAPAHVKKNIDKALGFGSSKKFLWILFPVLVALIATPFIYHAFQSEDLAQSSDSDTISQNSPNNNSQSNQTITNSQNSNNEPSSISKTEERNDNKSPITTSANNSINATSETNETGNASVNFGTNTTTRKINENSTVKADTKKINANNPSGAFTNKTTNPNSNLNLGGDITTTPPPSVKNDTNSTSNKSRHLNSTTSTDTTENTTSIIASKAPLNDPVNGGNKNAIDPKSTLPPSVDKDTSVSFNEKDFANNPPADSLIQIENTDTITIADNPGNDTTTTAAPIERIKDPYQPWMLSLTTGINFKKSNITIANLSDSAAYNNALNDKIGHSASFDAQYRLKNSLTFGAGFGYSTHIENYNFYKSEVVSDSSLYYVYFQDSIPDSSGWIYFQDSTAQYNYTTDTNEIYNANGRNINTFLHIPVSIGTQLRFNKFLVDLYAMGRFNLLLISKTTYVQNDQLVTTSLANIKRSYFDLVLGTNVHYNLVGNLYLTGTLRYRAPFNSPYYVNGVSNRFSNLHVGLGISLNL